MKIAGRVDYALSCLLRIADKCGKGAVTAQEIAEKENLKEDYVEQLLILLRRKGIIKSTKGQGGGYLLAKSPSRITMKDVIEAIEKDVLEIVCFRKKGRRHKCAHMEDCRIRGLWMKVKRDVELVFDKFNLEKMLSRRKKEKNWNKI